jgi:hypothetical protein
VSENERISIYVTPAVGLSMMRDMHADLVGREVYTADGRRMGVILAISRSKKAPDRARAWIERGSGSRVVRVDELEIRRGKIFFKNAHSAWLDGVPLYC